MSNLNFIKAIVKAFQTYDREAKTGAEDEVTREFTLVLKKEIYPEDNSNTEDEEGGYSLKAAVNYEAIDQQKIIFALFKYCISKPTQKTPILYANIIKNLNSFAISNDVDPLSLDFETKKEDRAAIITAFTDLLREFPRQLPENPKEWAEDVDHLLSKLLYSFENPEENKANILINSGYMHILVDSINFYLQIPQVPQVQYYPKIYISALQRNPALGLRILEKLPLVRAGTKASHIALEWLELLKNNAIPVNATYYGTTFIPYYFEHVHNISVTRIDSYIYAIANKLNELTTAANAGALLSTFCTPRGTLLQELATASIQNTARYAYKTEMYTYILTLLALPGITIQDEKHPVWLEILMQGIEADTPNNELQQVIDAIPATMWQEFFDKKVHKRLKQKLANSLQIKDFWQQYPIIADQNIFLNQVIQKITAGKTDVPDAHDAIVQSFDTNYNRLAPQKHSELDSVENLIRELRLQTQSTINDTVTPFVSTSQLQVVITDEFSKKEVSRFIQVCLTHLENNFSYYKEPEAKIISVVNFNKNLEIILRVYGLSFDELVLKNAASKTVLTSMLTTILLFNEGPNLSQTEMYKAVQQDPNNIVNKFLALQRNADADSQVDVAIAAENYLKFLGQQAAAYKSNPTVMLKSSSLASFFGTKNESNTECTDFIQKICSEYAAAKTNPRFYALKVMIRMVDYLITSYTERVYEKGFFLHYLKGQAGFIATPDLMKYMAQNKEFLIATLNASLRKLKFKDYQTSDRATALKVRLDSLFSVFSTTIVELDDYAQTIYAYLDNVIYIALLRYPGIDHAPDEEFLLEFIAEYFKTKQVSADDAKRIIDIYYKSCTKTEGFGDGATAVSLLKSVPFIAAAVGCRTASFDGAAYLLAKFTGPEGVSKISSHGFGLWAYILAKGYSDLIVLNNRPLLSYAHDLSGGSVYLLDYVNRTILFFNDIPVVIKQQIMNAAYPYDKDHQRPKVEPQEKADLSGFLADYTTATPTDTFNPVKWQTRYKNHYIRKDESYTLLQRLALNINKNDTTIEKIAKDIVLILKLLGDIPYNQGHEPAGHWIEILLIHATYRRSIDDLNKFKQIYIDEILPLIAVNQSMLESFFDTGLAETINRTLIEEADFLSDNPHDQLVYELYFRLLSTLVTLESKRDRVDELSTDGNGLLQSVVAQLAFYPNAIDQFTARLWEAEVYSDGIKFKQRFDSTVTRVTHSDSILSIATQKTLRKKARLDAPAKERDDKLYDYTRKICKAFKEVLFGTTIVPLTAEHESSQFFKDIKAKKLSMNAAQKAQLCQSLKKSFQRYLEQNRDFNPTSPIPIFSFLDVLVKELELDPKQLVPDTLYGDNTNARDVEACLWVTAFTEEKLSNNFDFIVTDRNDDFINFDNPIDADAQAKRDTFMNRVSSNGTYKTVIQALKIKYESKSTRSEKNIQFIKTLIQMMQYAFSDKDSFYNDCLKANMSAIQTINLPDSYKLRLFYILISLVKNSIATISQNGNYVLGLAEAKKQETFYFINLLGLQKLYVKFDFADHGFETVGSILKETTASKTLLALAPSVSSSSSASSSVNLSTNAASSAVIAKKEMAKFV